MRGARPARHRAHRVPQRLGRQRPGPDRRAGRPGRGEILGRARHRGLVDRLARSARSPSTTTSTTHLARPTSRWRGAATLRRRRTSGCSRSSSPEGDDPDEPPRRGAAPDARAGRPGRRDATSCSLHENEKDIYGDIPRRCLDIVESVGSPAPAAGLGRRQLRPGAASARSPTATPMLRPHLEYVQVKDALAGRRRVVPAGEGDGETRGDDPGAARRRLRRFFSLEPHLAVGRRARRLLRPRPVRARRTRASPGSCDAEGIDLLDDRAHPPDRPPSPAALRHRRCGVIGRPARTSRSTRRRGRRPCVARRPRARDARRASSAPSTAPPRRRPSRRPWPRRRRRRRDLHAQRAATPSWPSRRSRPASTSWSRSRSTSTARRGRRDHRRPRSEPAGPSP